MANTKLFLPVFVVYDATVPFLHRPLPDSSLVSQALWQSCWHAAFFTHSPCLSALARLLLYRILWMECERYQAQPCTGDAYPTSFTEVFVRSLCGLAVEPALRKSFRVTQCMTDDHEASRQLRDNGRVPCFGTEGSVATACM